MIFFFGWLPFGFVFFLFFSFLSFLPCFKNVEAITFPSFPLRGHLSKLMNGRNIQIGKSPPQNEHLEFVPHSSCPHYL